MLDAVFLLLIFTVTYKMKYSLLIYCILLWFLGFGQTTNWQWAQGANGPGFEEGYNVAADKNGNVYLVGNIEGGNAIFGADTALCGGNQTGFIVKYNAAGAVIWVKNMTNAGDNFSTTNGVTTDDSDNVYATGNFSGSIRFGDSVLFSSSSGTDLFIVKYDSSGHVLWSRRGGQTNGSGIGVTTDRIGNVFVAGWVSGGGNDFFINKYSSIGQPLWHKADGGGANITPFGIAADNMGNAYVTGSVIADSVNFDTIRLYPVVEYFNGGTFTHDINTVFLVKYDPNGNAIWARGSRGNYPDIANGVTTDTSGNIYITGSFESDSMVLGGQIVYNSKRGSHNEFFLAKYNAKGDALWAKSTMGSGGQIGYSVAADVQGNIFVSGSLGSDTLIFDSVLRIFYPSGSTDAMFVATYDDNGNALCAAALTSGGDDQNGICADNRGNAYTGGDFEINPFIIGKDTLLLPANVGGGNEEAAFVAKFNCGQPTELNIKNVMLLPTLQLHPNPFTNQAIVQYSLPDGSKNAALIIYDILGRQRNSYQLTNTEGEININSTGLSSGVYLYSLVVDGKTLATKKMVVQE